jgi:hypothetical protein
MRDSQWRFVRFGTQGKKENRTGKGMQKGYMFVSRPFNTLSGACVRQNSQMTDCIAGREARKKKKRNNKTRERPGWNNGTMGKNVLSMLRDTERPKKSYRDLSRYATEANIIENLQTNMEPKKWYLRDKGH